MYRLQVFVQGAATAVESNRIKVAADVLSAIPDLVKRHPSCTKIVVIAGDRELFAVDCHGNRLAD